MTLQPPRPDLQGRAQADPNPYQTRQDREDMNINPTTTGIITLTPLRKSGAPRVGMATHGLVTDYAEHEDGSVSYSVVSHHYVARGITEPYILETLRYKPNRSRVALEFTSVADAPHLAKQFGRLYYTQEMAVSDCE